MILMKLITPLSVKFILILLMFNSLNTLGSILFKLFFKNPAHLEKLFLLIGTILIFLIIQIPLAEAFIFSQLAFFPFVLVWTAFFGVLFCLNNTYNLSNSYCILSILVGPITGLLCILNEDPNFYLISGRFLEMFDLSSHIESSFPLLIVIYLIAILNGYLFMLSISLNTDNFLFKKSSNLVIKIALLVCLFFIISYSCTFYISFSVSEIIAFQKPIASVFVTSEGFNTFPELKRISFFNIICKISLFISIFIVLFLYNTLTNNQKSIDYFKTYFICLVTYYVVVFLFFGKPLVVSTFLSIHGIELLGTSLERLVNNYLCLLLMTFMTVYILFTVILVFLPIAVCLKLGLTLVKDFLCYLFINGFTYFLFYGLIDFSYYEDLHGDSFILNFLAVECCLLPYCSGSFCMEDDKKSS